MGARRGRRWEDLISDGDQPGLLAPDRAAKTLQISLTSQMGPNTTLIKG